MERSSQPEENEAKRWQIFQGHLKKVCRSNSFQKNRFPELSKWESWSGFDDFIQSCPLTTKQELEQDQVSNPPHGSNVTFPLDQYLRYSKTSGTTGQGMEWMDTAEDWQWMLENWKLIIQAAGVASGDCCFFAFSFGPFLGFWTAYEAAVQAGCVCIPGGGLSTEVRIRSILENKVNYLFCTPTYARRMLETAREQQIDLQNHQLKKIIVAGECGGSSLEIRKQMDDAWSSDSLLYDHYGMTEVGPVAYEIPGGKGGLRILSDRYLAEVIDPESLQPLEDGELGELVLTPLGRTGNPLLRYRTGDLVRVHRGLDDGGFPVFDLVGGILGRADDMIVVRGVNLYPLAVDGVIRKFGQVDEYQVMINEVRGMKEVLIRVEADEPTAKELEKAMYESFSLRIPVEVVPAKSLPRWEMKSKRWCYHHE